MEESGMIMYFFQKKKRKTHRKKGGKKDYIEKTRFVWNKLCVLHFGHYFFNFKVNL